MASIKPLVALVDTTGKVTFDNLQKLAKAMQYQITQDVKPVWNVDAEIIAYQTEKEIPFGAWKHESRNLKGLKAVIFKYCEKWLGINSDRYCNLVNSNCK